MDCVALTAIQEDVDEALSMVQLADGMHKGLVKEKEHFRLGYGLIEIIPADIARTVQYRPVWGKYNDRGINIKAMQQMQDSFVRGAMRRWHEPIPVLVRREWLDGVDQLEQVGTEDVLMKLETVVRWTNDVRGKRVDYLNGRHRSLAAAAAKKQVMKEKAEMEKNDEDAKQATMTKLERLSHLKVKERVTSVLPMLGTWVAVFYDISECICSLCMCVS